MLVEINLLPKKETAKSSRLLFALFVLALIGASCLAVYLKGSILQTEMSTLDRKIESVQELNEAQQAKLVDGDPGNAESMLKTAVVWVEQLPLETVPLLRSFIALLPERGFIKEFEYSSVSSVIVKAQFDASRDAAFYLSSLKQAEWVEEARILKVETNTGNQGNAEAEGSQNEEEIILPRYNAEYEIIFKPEHFKKNKDVAAKGVGE